MGNELVSGSLPPEGEESDTDSSSSFSYTKVFDTHFPFYLAIGMSYEQYWNGDCELVKAYKKAYELKREMVNEQAWLQGMYFYEALCDVSPILHAFAQGGTKPNPYANEPYAITEEEQKIRKERDEQRRFNQFKAKLSAFANQYNTKITDKGDEASGTTED